MKKAKKILALLLCAVLLVCATVAGTLAYLKATTTTVTNTFVAAGGDGPFIDKKDDDTYKFELKEYEVTQSSTGKYTLNNNVEVSGLEYEAVMPGTTIPKQAFVKLSRTATRTETTDGETTSVKEIAPAPAYLYLEVIDGLPKKAYSWEVDSSNWTILTGLKGVDGGDVYLYTGSLADTNHVITSIAAYNANMIDIIKDDKVTVADEELDGNPVSLSFNAYLAQASTGETDDPAAVFAACFK